MQQELDAENATKGTNPDISAQVVKQLQWNVDVTGKELFVSADRKMKVQDDRPISVT